MQQYMTCILRKTEKEIAVNQKANVTYKVCFVRFLRWNWRQVFRHRYMFLRIVNGNVEDAGSVTRNGAGAVTAASIHTNGFFTVSGL